jgi:nucleotide-binding universal stress UspA family protein
MPETESTQTQGPTATADPTFANILCAISGREGGYAAVEQAAGLAGTQGHLTLLAVTSFRSGGARRAPAIGPGRAAEILHGAEAIAREAGVAYTSEVDPRSPPARVILDWSSKFDLLALGAPASSWPAKLLSVGVGDKALGGFASALLVARPLAAGRRLGERVVVASDGLPSSDALVDLASRLAHAHGSTVTLVHGLGREPLIHRDRPREQDGAVQQQEQMLSRARAAGASESLVKPGRPADVIRSAAAETDASLVVMGSRRLDGLRAMGSVSRRVVHQAPCSVLLVSPETLTR